METLSLGFICWNFCLYGGGDGRALELDSIIILVCVHFLSLSLSLALSLSDSPTVLAHSRGRLFFMISCIHSPFFSFGHIISLSLLCVLRASLPRAEIERRRKKGGRWTSGLRSKRDRHKKGESVCKNRMFEEQSQGVWMPWL